MRRPFEISVPRPERSLAPLGMTRECSDEMPDPRLLTLDARLPTS
jgi:hypothetical protein